MESMKRLFVLLLLTTVTVFAQKAVDPNAPRADLCRDPFRQLVYGDWVLNYDLRPLFTWFQTRQGERPMREWNRMTVTTMDPSGTGLLVLNSVDNKVFLLRNYPYFVPKKTVIDVFAVTLTEAYVYKDSSGTEQTVPVYDYGLMYF